MNVQLCKEEGVLGVRIAGGSDKPYGRGLVRIKQVTADTAGSRSGVLLEGDIILQVTSQPEANIISILTPLTLCVPSAKCCWCY